MADKETFELALRMVLEGNKDVVAGLDNVAGKIDKLNKSEARRMIYDRQINKQNKEQVKLQTSIYRTYLPILFTTQKLAEATSGLLGPSQDLLGTQQIWSTMLGVAFLPTAEKQLDSLMALGDQMDSLPESIQQNIGDNLLNTQIMAQGAGMGAQLATALGGITDPAGAAAGEITGLGLAARTLSNSALTAVASVSGLESTTALAAITALTATGDVSKLTDAGQKLSTEEFIARVTMDDKTYNDTMSKINAVDTAGTNATGSKGLTITADNTDATAKVAIVQKALDKIFMTGPIVTAKYLPPGITTGTLPWGQTGLGQMLSNWLQSTFGIKLPGYQQGGPVKETGLAYLHQGEYVVPANQTFSPTYNINATLGSNMDIRRLATQLNNYQYEEWRRMSMR